MFNELPDYIEESMIPDKCESGNIRGGVCSLGPLRHVGDAQLGIFGYLNLFDFLRMFTLLGIFIFPGVVFERNYVQYQKRFLARRMFDIVLNIFIVRGNTIEPPADSFSPRQFRFCSDNILP